MDSRKWIIRGLVVFCLCAGNIFGQEKQAPIPPAPVMMTISIDYWYCAQPSRSDWIAFNDEDKKKYPDCSKWQERLVQKLAQFDSNAYDYKGGAARANWFVSDAAQQIYGTGLPKNSAGEPGITLKELYNDPGKFGWIEIPADRAKPGSFAIWPTVGGLVISENSSPATDSTQTKTNLILYPSDKEKGALAKTKAIYLDPNSKPKYLIPIPKGASQDQKH